MCQAACLLARSEEDILHVLLAILHWQQQDYHVNFLRWQWSCGRNATLAIHTRLQVAGQPGKWSGLYALGFALLFLLWLAKICHNGFVLKRTPKSSNGQATSRSLEKGSPESSLKLDTPKPYGAATNGTVLPLWKIDLPCSLRNLDCSNVPSRANHFDPSPSMRPSVEDSQYWALANQVCHFVCLIHILAQVWGLWQNRDAQRSCTRLFLWEAYHEESQLAFFPMECTLLCKYDHVISLCIPVFSCFGFWTFFLDSRGM